MVAIQHSNVGLPWSDFVEARACLSSWRVDCCYPLHVYYKSLERLFAAHVLSKRSCFLHLVRGQFPLEFAAMPIAIASVMS